MIDCLSKDNKIDQTNCAFNLLNEITSLQDEIQLSIPRPNESIALSLATINDANGIILELSKWKGHLPPIVESGYATEKVNSLPKNYDSMIHDYNISHDKDNAHNGIVCTTKEPITSEEQETQKYMHDTIFKGIKYDPTTCNLTRS